VLTRCPRCQRSRPVSVQTDGRGRLVDTTGECACLQKYRAHLSSIDHERRSAGLCQTCDASIPKRGRGFRLYCPGCKDKRRAARSAAHQQSTGKQRYASYYQRNRDDYLARRRAAKIDPAVRAARNASSRKWWDKHPEQIKAIRRRRALSGKPARECAKRRARIASGRHVVSPKPERYNESGQHLCRTADCPNVIAGRAKMCSECKTARRSA
jgi:hypothetical protein